MPENETYTIFWEGGDRNVMSSDEIADLPFDAASWISFTNMLMKRCSYAIMTLHPPEVEKLRVKVKPVSSVQPGDTFQNLL